MVLGDDRPDVATSWNNLAFVHKAKCDYARAEEGFEQVLAIRRKVYGDDHPDVAAASDNLASVHHAKGEYDKAEEGHKQAMAIGRKVSDNDHPDVAWSLNNLANVWLARASTTRQRRDISKPWRYVRLCVVMIITMWHGR